MTIAVVLFNLGGPDSQAAVRPFLFNLFHDPAIIRLPQPLRWLIAQLISRRREKKAQGIYAQMGGRSPILPLTEAQAQALETALGEEYKVFVCMRYWHPMSAAVAREVAACAPSKVILLPLYPQYSTTTTASSVKDWQQAAEEVGITAPTEVICCYPNERFFAEAQAELIDAALQAQADDTPLRLLFSAHGLPEKIVAAGDPYAWQVERSVEAALAALATRGHRPDWRLSYQSRVGPMAWIGPSTEEEIARAGTDGVGLMVIPIAFVSEHSETLVELDIEYRHLAEQAGVPSYARVPALGTAPAFISGLAELVQGRVAKPNACAPASGARLCPPGFTGCACRAKDPLPPAAC